MVAQNYEVCERRVLLHEGGYTNHPSDPGGPTNFGITIFDYRKYIKPNATAADVKAMKREEAKAIYRAKYWNALRCDDLYSGIDDSVFDYGVNSGVGRAGKVLRRVIGMPDSDWHVTAPVLNAVHDRDPKMVIMAINDERLRFLKRLKTWPTFGGGWGRRVAEVRAFSLQIADQPTMAAMPALQAAGKGIVPVPKLAVDVVQVAGGGAAAGGAAATAHDGVWAWLVEHPWEAGLMVAGGMIALGGVIYFVNRWHQAQQEAPIPDFVPVPALAA